jgi:hypothetical protein
MYDNWIIPFGKYKWTGLCRLPSSYLLGLYGDKIVMAKHPEIKSYIETNIEKLKEGNGIKVGLIPPVTMPCSKYCYLTEHEARKELMRISETDSEKKPVRYYYCDKCGAYHLTSKELFGNIQK